MSGPGKGRYTTYVPVASNRNTLLHKLFNNQSANDVGVFYGSVDQSDNIKAAEAVVATAVPLLTAGSGDKNIFPAGVDMSFHGTPASPVPNLADVTWKSASEVSKAGGPAFAYLPDVTSPGDGKTSALDKSTDPGIKQDDVKPNYIPGAPGTGTASPSSTSVDIGAFPVGRDLTPGKSSV